MAPSVISRRSVVLWGLPLIVLFLLSACSAPATPTPAPATAPGEAFFKPSGNCAACHQGLKDSTGADVSIVPEWQTSVMGNAALDPYFRASVRMELLNAPQYADAIQSKCATCHTPMARVTQEAQGESTALLGEEGVLAEGHVLGKLALDGVSCTVCHQIPQPPAGELRHSGNMAIDTVTAMGERLLYGALPISEQNRQTMQAASGYLAVQSEHVRQSQLCATCHELYLNYITADGSLSGEDALFYEQTPFSEWLASDFAQQSSCQDCHMPAAAGSAPVSNITPQNTYQPFYRHTFTGGNVFLLTLLKDGKVEGVRNPGGTGLDAHIARTTEYLQTRTATLAITSPRQEGDRLEFAVRVDLLTGHKFPTSFPSRRAWLHVTVKDASGRVVFESGGYDREGKIQGNANDEDPAAYEPHYTLITAADQVQIYEPVMQTETGKVTTYQLLAASYIKDNRLLPRGFNKSQPPRVSAVVGDALNDPDFIGGGDTVQYRIPVNPAGAPFTIEAELLYQSVSYRWAKNVLDTQSAEAQTFGGMLAQTGNVTVMVASASVQSR